MRIVIDMQAMQSTGSRNRGIGHYSLSLIQAILCHAVGKHEIFLALNGLFPDTIEPIRTIFNGLLPQENIRVWQTPAPVNSLNIDNDWRRHTGELVREYFLASLKPDVILVTSLFEGAVDNTVTSVNLLDSKVPTAVILYDLIPLIYRQLYLENPTIEGWYENKLYHLRRADLLLTISESSRQEVLNYLNFPNKLAVNISAAVSSDFSPLILSNEQETNLRKRYCLHRPFVMYTGGIDHRKNIERLICAYAKLPKSVRNIHQLVIVCSIQPNNQITLETLAKKEGLAKSELILTGFVSDKDLIALYNLCKCFAFPSWHEGFGLPVLEAMACGKAVIAANIPSIIETMSREDALFDPHNVQDITNKLYKVLTDDDFRIALESHCLEQAKKFSWDMSAQRTLVALEELFVKKSLAAYNLPKRLKLAYVSPLPPERSGISDYSAELLPELSRHYDIDVIVEQDTISDPWIKTNCQQRSVAWFEKNAAYYDRILYHFGNSSFHQYMFNLLIEFPGVVVLHDFFLSGVIYNMDTTMYQPNVWIETLYRSHGYLAIKHLLEASDPTELTWQYPCNADVLQNALGIIVHSQNSIQLAKHWYHQATASDWSIIPLLRVPIQRENRSLARKLVKLSDDAFVVCSFGILGVTKLNHRLLDAWLASDLAKDKKCILIFAGLNETNDYENNLLNKIKQSGLKDRIFITGWTDASTFRHYLSSVDIGVQLRTLSRGETSGTVLDCMNYGIPTIINANGSMADLPSDAVWKLQENFDNEDLTRALNTLWLDCDRRTRLRKRAREIIITQHSPRICANKYAQAIEKIYDGSITKLFPAISQVQSHTSTINPQDMASLADAIAISIPAKYGLKRLFIDISELVQRDSKTGIQRVVRNILQELLTHPPTGYRVEPIYATEHDDYRYARQFTLQFLNCQSSETHTLKDDKIEFQAGDIFFGLDLQPAVVSSQQKFYKKIRNYGVRVYFLVYDLLPILQPSAFLPEAKKNHESWLQVVTQNDGAICISKCVADELADWLRINANRYSPQKHFKIDWFHLGADIKKPRLAIQDISPEEKIILDIITAYPTFLMVSTIEPRKSHTQVIAAFEHLWADGLQVNLILVGKRGWMVDDLIDKISHHAELGKRLFWLEGISDDYLEKIYTSSTCLIAASKGEGFGLSLIEAAQYELPIIARDLPIFREVAGNHAYYFSGLGSESLAEAISNWLALDAEGKAPQSDDVSWLTWRQSTEQLLNILSPERACLSIPKAFGT